MIRTPCECVDPWDYFAGVGIVEDSNGRPSALLSEKLIDLHG